NLGDAADLFRGNIAEPRPAGTNYALETGVPALLELYQRYRLPFTYFVEGWSAEHYPDLVRQMHADGAEIGMHGWQHEIWHLLDDHEVDELLPRAHTSLTRTLGKAPTVFRAPGGKTTAHTQKLLAALGYRIDASLQDYARPSRALGQLINVPYQWPGVDATHWLWHKRSPEDALQQWLQAIDHAVGNQEPLVFIFHSHVMGMKPERLQIGERLIQHVLDDKRLQIMSLADIGAKTT
ncbi:MAG TPA: polysaccharide deacetylase family protein, partial [Candidatus Acidoferrum sp.]|nr:polysaccharide deacetylase family protein [Candidatus Acidoferrum sp.]